MRTTIIILTTIIALLHPQAAAAQNRALAIDPSHSVAQFTVTKLGFTDVTGRFMQMDGDIRWNPDTPETAHVRWRVKVASVKTDAENRDRTLEAPEYFDANHHPWLTFESTRVHRLDPRRLEVIGNLTMRGVSREITVIVTHSGTTVAPVFETSFDVDRYDYGIVGGRVMSRLIGRVVRIQLTLVTLESIS